MKKIISITSFQDKLVALTTVQKVLLFTATVGLMIAAFYFFKFEDQTNSIRRLTNSIGEQEKKLATLKAASLKVEVLEKELAQSEEELKTLLALLPDQKEIPGLLENVSRLGSKVGLENILFKPQPEVPKEYYAVIPIQLDLLGSFNDLGVFLDSVSKLNRILKVEALTMTRPKGKQASLLQVGCTVVTYRFIEEPVAPKGKAAPKKK
ncbi:MAG: type 4a pilus biogenesis protein PilO [Syntrophobacteraceae bacterium]